VGLFSRPRLVDFLHENLNRKLILLSAAAGYGKTSLLVDFLRDSEIKACWYALDEGDADPRIFVSHFVASVTETFPQMEGGPLAGMVTAGLAETEPLSAMGLLINEIQERIPDYFAILLDDLQFVDASPGVIELLTWFMDHQPDSCCLIIASRSMPDLPYLKLTAKQEIAGLGSEDLAFTPEEIQEYLAKHHEMEISPEEARELGAQSEGWITGILLGTHTLWKGLLRTLSEAKGKDEQVFEYLAHEVFAHLPEETQRFLKSTSILKAIEPAFSDALLGIDNSEQLLDELEAANLFVVKLASEEPAYRYHALFREFLLGQIQEGQDLEQGALQRRAADLLTAAGDSEEGLEHYLEAKAWPEAIRILQEIGEPAYQAGRFIHLGRWIDSLEPEALAAVAELLVLRGRLYRQDGDFDQALEYLHRGRNVYLQVGDKGGEAAVRVREAYVQRYMGQLDEARRICDEVIAEAEAVQVPADALALAHRIVGEWHHIQGNLGEAKASFRRSLKLYEQAKNVYHTISMLQNLGTTAGRMGNPLEAESHYVKALELADKIGNRWRAADLRNNLGVGRYYRGDYVEALDILDGALRDAREVGHTRTESAILSSLGDVRFELGQIREARELFEDGLDKARSSGDTFLEVYALCSLGNLYRADHAWEQAHALIDQANTLVGDSSAGYLEGIICLYRGMVMCDQKRQQEAASVLQRAHGLLEASGAQRELAKATLWLARAHFQAGNKQAAYKQLKEAITLSEEIARPHLLVVDGSQMLSLIQEARSDEALDSATMDNLLTRISQYALETARRPHEAVPRKVSPPRLEVRTFGEATVLVDGRAISKSEWGGPLVKELFFFLLERGEARREVILETFWPKYSTAKAKGVFHATLYRMRHVVPKETIKFDDATDSYVFNRGSDFWYDAEVFEGLLGEVSRDSVAAPDLLAQAIRIYRGDLLPEVYSDWSMDRREELRRFYVDAVIRLAGIESELDHTEQSIKLYRQAIVEEPYREDAHRGMMKSLAQAGRQSEALQHFLDFAKALMDELQVQPTAETEELYNKIREEQHKLK
jgi:LuxR family maltose regulon positive regulatory protein